MLEIIKEVGIFIVIAQAVLYFVPGEAYVKYVKVIVGIIIIAKMAQPVLSLAVDGDLEEILMESQALGEELQEFAQVSPTQKDSYQIVCAGIEEEIRKQLTGTVAYGYQAKSVTIRQKGEEIYLTIRVTKKSQNADAGKEEEHGAGNEKEIPEALQQYYGELLGMDPEQLEIQIR